MVKKNNVAVLERLSPIVGDGPTKASVARYNQRLMNVFIPPPRLKDDEDETYQARYAQAMTSAQNLVRPPMLPIIGHGQQLAAQRMSALALPVGIQSDPTRQQLRRTALLAEKRRRSADKKEVLRTRRQKKA